MKNVKDRTKWRQISRQEEHTLDEKIINSWIVIQAISQDYENGKDRRRVKTDYLRRYYSSTCVTVCAEQSPSHRIRFARQPGFGANRYYWGSVGNEQNIIIWLGKITLNKRQAWLWKITGDRLETSRTWARENYHHDWKMITRILLTADYRNMNKFAPSVFPQSRDFCMVDTISVSTVKNSSFSENLMENFKH